jgi:L-serine dehydratase
MKLSILNHVIGPVIRGPSSSHTGASYFIGKLARGLLLDDLLEARIIFDKKGSYAKVYRQEASDLAFVSGLLGLDLMDEKFKRSIELAKEIGIKIEFSLSDLGRDAHPDEVVIEMKGRKRKLTARARSIGGGMFEFLELNGRKVMLTGDEYIHIFEAERGYEPKGIEAYSLESEDGKIVIVRSPEPSYPSIEGVRRRVLEPIFLPMKGKEIFSSGFEVEKFCEKEGMSLGEAGLRYEAELLGKSEQDVLKVMIERYKIMKRSIEEGLSGEVRLRVLKPSASTILRKLERGELAVGGLHTKAAALSMAVMHACNSSAIVVAAPTGGSAGVIPGVTAVLEEELGLSEEEIAKSLFAAGVIGLIIGKRATFAAEEAGCQVEIGAAGAMASAMVMEASGGSCKQALDAAAISLQNIVGMVCDPVGGFVEVPCHTRNAIAAASAFVNADIIMGGYENPIPLDETVDAVYSVGKMMPWELRCTVMGGLAVCPSAMKFMPKIE